ncbi:hypothetical protein KAFR_0C03500 [Kazachstania africana CBS 2517]|uniref:alanine--glyoxylate transaminase n=1 Tax=Kazachstania africana (strain ATCC 22294 / BCRC 22015 / CBS 2517 / CECT 1963 / NBRC 1671 / NRRL Y-8276) TaxID=1071382 RepID=H2ASJ2_KAZAF|nr:hypothetical protein KAFR_0C03500 [Kazachstania africana CBS 2517]CCF57342.1 hypothetical protein KAFR_0C03500 [Kazachstania africana CBS 2517]
MSQDTLLIPGPVTLSKNVINTLGSQSLSHLSPEFTSIFKEALQNSRSLFKAHPQRGQPLIIAGSGTLGFDLVGTNLIDPINDKILLLSTGFFSNEFATCLEQNYKVQHLNILKAPIGGVVPMDQIVNSLQQDNYKAIIMTHVDTSTGVRSDVEKISQVVKKISPNTLIVVDAVCSLGCETLKFHDWGLDFALSASQKALGMAPGLSVCMISDRALDVALDEKTKPTGFYASIKNWYPVLKNSELGVATYFATPPVQLIAALNVALKEILSYKYKGLVGIDARVAKHADVSKWFKTKMVQELHLKLLPSSEKNAANGLSAIYADDPASLISYLKNEKHIIVAAGILKEIKSKYFRVGHMGVSACDDSLGQLGSCFDAIQEILQQ